MYIFNDFSATEDQASFKQRIRNHYCPGPAWQPTDPCYLDLATNQAQVDELLAKRRATGCSNDQTYCYGFDNVSELLIPTPTFTPTPTPAPIPTPAPTVSEPLAQKPTESAESKVIKARLAALQAEVEAEKAKKEAEIKAIQEMQAKQAAYGRDVLQVKPKQAGYSTEAEKLMGGRTGYGYYSKLGNAQFGGTIDQAADNVKKATKVVEELTDDVKKGMATRSELQAAMIDLDAKIKIAKALVKSKNLKGYGEESKSSLLWWSAAIILIYLILRSKI